MRKTGMKKLAILMAIVLIGAMFITIETATACHSKSASCNPSEKDIIELPPKNDVTYKIELTLNPGCGSTFWVQFTALSQPPPGWSYSITDANGADIEASSPPPDANHNNDPDWVPAGSGSNTKYDAYLKVTSPSGAENGEQAVITVRCWSCDSVPNDLDKKDITTTTTVNIPDGIRLYPKHILEISKEAYPGETVDFDIEVQNLGEAGGLIDFSKDVATYYEENGGGDWTGWGTLGTDYSISPNPATLPPQDDDTTETRLTVTIPITAKQSDKLVFVIRGTAQVNVSYSHTTSCFVNIIEYLPDLELSNDHLTIFPESPRDGDEVLVNITVNNNGHKDASNFELEFALVGEEHKVAPQIKTITDTLTTDGSKIVTFIWAGADVEEGDHSVCIEVDKPTENKPNGAITEEDENNNLAGIVVTVGPPRVKWIEGTIYVDPETCNPSDTITVSGIAKYNADFGNTPVKNGDVTVEIEGTTISETTTTDNAGNYAKELTAPTECKKYRVTVDIVDSEQIGLKDGEKLEAIIEVRSLAVEIKLNPSYCLAEDSVMVSGRVMDPDEKVTGATVTIEIDGETGSWDTTTDPNGGYTKTITAPTPTAKTDYTVTVTAVKGELKGSASDTLTVDLDTDGDGKGNDVDEDDDGDGIDDDVEDQYGSKPLDNTSKPDIDPVAVAGDDQTAYEGDTVNFDGSGSSDLYGSIVSFGWNFGDSSTDGTGDKPNHKYADDGTYTVTLTVKDNDDKYASDTLTVTVLDKPPTAVLTCAKTSEEEDNKVKFDASGSTCISVDTIEKYEWDWDYDGETFEPSTSTSDSDPQATHKWSKPGEYTVAVRVTDDDDSTAIATYKIIITEAPEDNGGLLGGDGKGSDSGVAVLAIIVVIVIAIIIAVVFVFMKKGKKPPETKKDERVNIATTAQTTTRPSVVQPHQQPPAKTPTGQERDWNWDFRE